MKSTFSLMGLFIATMVFIADTRGHSGPLPLPTIQSSKLRTVPIKEFIVPKPLILQILWSFTNLTLVDHFEVKESTDLTHWIIYTETTNTSLIVSNANKNSEFFKVAAYIIGPPNTNNAVILDWDAPTNVVGIAGYMVHCGVSSLVYTNHIDVGMNLQTTVSGLINGNTYYFNCSDYDIFSISSLYDGEVIYLVPSAISDIVGLPITIKKL